MFDVLLAQTIPLTKISAAVFADDSSHSRAVGESRGGVVHDAVVIIRDAATVDSIGVVLVKVVCHPCEKIEQFRVL